MTSKDKFWICTIFFLLVSCKNTESKKVELNEKVEKPTKITFSPPPFFLDSLKSEKEILQHLKLRKEEIRSLLQDSKPEKANEIWRNLKIENDSALILLESKQQDLLAKYYEFNNYNPETQLSTMNFPDDVKKIVNDYENADIEFWEIGEGMTILRMVPDYYEQLFRGKLTADYQEYLKIIVAEDKVLFQADAGIIIPWHEVAKRVEVRENFLKKYPNSTMTKTIHKELKEYRYAYLLGYDNTQTHEQGTFYPENITEFQRFIKSNPRSETSEIIKQMLREKFSREELGAFVRQKIKY